MEPMPVLQDLQAQALMPDRVVVGDDALFLASRRWMW
jgi:hypothetical protein